jgi:hypothetical protein
MNNLQFLIFEPPEKVKRPNLLHSYDHIFSKITSTSPLFPPPRGYWLLTVGLAITMKTIYSILAFLAWSTVAIAQTSSDVLVGPQTTLQTFVSVRTILETITSVETSVWTAVVTSGGSTFISKSSFAPPRENYSWLVRATGTGTIPSNIATTSSAALITTTPITSPELSTITSTVYSCSGTASDNCLIVATVYDVVTLTTSSFLSTSTITTSGCATAADTVSCSQYSIEEIVTYTTVCPVSTSTKTVGSTVVVTDIIPVSAQDFPSRSSITRDLGIFFHFIFINTQ